MWNQQGMVWMMKIKRCIYVMVAIFLLLLNWLEMGLAVMLDDYGDAITEAEIEANIGSVYRKGCAIGGGLLAFPISIGFRNAKIAGIPIFAIAFEAISIGASHNIGKHFDKRRAISYIAQQRGWSERNPVLDDNGYLITKAEIEANMGTGYRTGYVITGGSIGLIPALWGITIIILAKCTCECIFDDCDCDCPGAYNDIEFWVGWSAAEASIIIGSYYIGKHSDRTIAIEHIKAQRRKKKHAFGEQNVTDGVYFQLLNGTF
jgi:hypothetical protein